ncbi:ABC transporter ATP-binding protein [Candidatus Chromulinivorax destructor]|nr:ABC transporter ATP-binding protein [Candidatus Chromulinivorax destructor]
MKLGNKIVVHDLTFSFNKNSKKFFDKLHVDFVPGTLNFIQGKNGVGKSTLLKIFSGNMSPDHQLQGTLHINCDVYDFCQPDTMSKAVAFVPQKFDELLVDSYSLYENLQFAQMSAYPSLVSLPKIVALPKLLDEYGIDYTIPVSLLSGGQRQILSMLMMLERNPKILLLDEPTAALDEENTKLVMSFLQNLCVEQGMTIIAIVHNQELVDTYAPSGYFELVQHDGKRAINFVSSKI